MSQHNPIFDNIGPPLPDVRSIVALRPNAIGDFMFSLPALHALRHTYPRARIVLLGKKWHADFLRQRPSPVDEVIVMPPVPGVGAPPDARVDRAAVDRFVEEMRNAHFDLAIQMYGGGGYSNAFIKRLGAKLTIGTKTPEAAPLDRWIPYGEIYNRRLELLQLVAMVGARPLLMEREVTVTEQDRREAAQLLPPRVGERIVVIHPGASDVRRHWPTERFAAVADALASRGATIVISATETEGHLARAIASRMRHPALDFTGRLSLSALCGLLDRADMMVSNDTGPLHLALALGTPTVGIFWLTNLMESGPLRQHLLRPALSVQAQCPVCGVPNLKSRCEHDVCFVGDVSTEKVAQMALELFDEVARPQAADEPEPALLPHVVRRGPTRSDAAAGRAAPSA
ncbi:MAG TPA: glycosyltransferase family 9 protein [Methylophilaceae bacterium]|nr:glycosyltransferase family 9 protein [Methylophilaceae bacterium]